MNQALRPGGGASMLSTDFGKVLALALAASGCAKTQATAPSADASAVTTASAQSAAASKAAQLVTASPSADPSVSAPKAEEAATLSAEAWLALLDQGNYVASWDTAATLLQRALARDEWASKVASVRGPLGKLVSRKIQSAKFMTSAPGVPDGKYVVITLSTSFENKRRAIETVTPMQDESGAWRVAGYYIK